MPLFWIVLAIAQAESGAIGDGAAVRLVLEQIGYGILAGVACGHRSPRASSWSPARHRYVGGAWLQVVPLAGAGLAFGVADPIGGSGFIAAFVGGFVFGALRRRAGGEVGHLIEELGEVLNAVTFIVFGAVLLGPVLGDVTWSIALYAVLSLTIVRHASRRDLDDRDRRATADAGVPRLVRPARARVDRLRGPGARGGRPAARRPDPRHHLRHDRTVGPRSRSHRSAAGQPLRRLVRVARDAPASRARKCRTFAGASAWATRAFKTSRAAVERRSSHASLVVEASAPRPRRRGPRRRHVRLPPADDRRLPRRLAGRAGHVVGVGPGARGGYGAQHPDLRAAVARAPPGPALLADADDDPGVHRARDRRAGRSCGRDRDGLRHVAALGASHRVPSLAR